jgi:hypothetical protein
VITAATPPLPKNTQQDYDKIIHGHAHAIIGFNARDQVVKIQNPWMRATHWTLSAIGQAQETKIKFGTVFELPLADFAKDFLYYTWEVK